MAPGGLGKGSGKKASSGRVLEAVRRAGQLHQGSECGSPAGENGERWGLWPTGHGHLVYAALWLGKPQARS